jgi:predicted Zn-dependent protease
MTEIQLSLVANINFHNVLPSSCAIQLLVHGHIDEASIYLGELSCQDSDNPDLFCYLGLCYVDLGQLDKGRELLHRCL